MSSEPESVGERLGATVQSYQAAVDDYDRELAHRLGVNETDLRCLEILLSQEEFAPSALSTRMGLTTGSVTTMLDRLEKLGYITRTPHPTDRRRSLVRVTPEATRLARRLTAPFIGDAAEKVAARFTPEQIETVIDFLAFTRDIQNEHTQLLRDVPEPAHRRSGGRQAPGPRTGARTRTR
ncbi:MarR family winged helix-turn-helix transcriptional regulator [Streptomyces paludis]|uniref:MarR family transcriptional regulator n=1 Tax=Streptomyces paludis TaxID=2282738 RepID=A0A345HW85_9ACTN|nr:MarR family transcriptional regulator [Streptomyces paludis]AXG80959.1 MarR family transcriptional regulator [Streptomyces paludis]